MKSESGTNCNGSAVSVPAVLFFCEKFVFRLRWRCAFEGAVASCGVRALACLFVVRVRENPRVDSSVREHGRWRGSEEYHQPQYVPGRRAFARGSIDNPTTQPSVSTMQYITQPREHRTAHVTRHHAGIYYLSYQEYFTTVCLYRIDVYVPVCTCVSG